jgi:iron complex outermembrane recepter protein
MMTRFKELLLATTGFAALIGGAAQAQAPTPFDIPAADLSQALDVFARQSGVPIVASPALLHGRRSAATAGTLAPLQALEAILAGTGLHAEIVDGAFVVRRNRPAKDGPPAPGDAADIVVTGTRIRGAAPIGSPVMVIDRKAIEESGRATLSDFLQTIPQNYGGGQTEATAGGNSIRGGAYVNTGYGTGINLRGLGSSSTLTLFDGNRPALGGYTASFSDISLIPTVAIDRIEMLMDGASSVYGSDAVAGVVNLRFRNHFEGVEARVFSGTADGAFGQEQASVIAGKRWNTGGVVLAYQFDHRGNLAASDRAYATQDLTRYGGPDNRTGYALPATIIAANGSIYSATRIGTTANPLQRAKPLRLSGSRSRRA